MIDAFKDLDKAFENKIRIGIMSVLMTSDANFNYLKNVLDVTDGNLASHLKSLEKIDYISFRKEFINRITNTSYSATEKGTIAFKKHINAIEKIIKNI